MTTLLEAEAARESAAARDRGRLQGVWIFVSGTREAELLFAGNHFTMKFRNGDIYLGTFRLDPTAKPKAIDVTVEEGPDRHRGKTSLGIYDLDGEHLIWAPSQPGMAERLTAFPPDNDPARLLFVFRHERYLHETV
jgi:uncharacterized protein (TIGR03067 family)